MNKAIEVKQEAVLYHFGMGTTNTQGLKSDLLGGKGFGLAEMASIPGIPVPPGFIIPTSECAPFLERGYITEDMKTKIKDLVNRIGSTVDRSFGDSKNPLLLSSRSGAAVSMPGMLKTILNVGVSRETIPGLAKQFNNERFAWDCYRRLIDMWGESVLGIDHEHFEQQFNSYKKEHSIKNDIDMTVDDLKKLCDIYEIVFEKHAGKAFPQDPWEQLFPSVEAVFRSWYGDKAVAYRKIEKLDDLLGTAVVIMAMVYGNLNELSGTGVLFTRNPSTGVDELYGEVLFNAQGEDVVAGIRTPLPISTLKAEMPETYLELVSIVKQLEKNRKDIQDIEFTIENGKLYMLQTRNGKRNGTAAFRIAFDMVKEGLVTKQHAIKKLLKPDHVLQVLLPCFSDETVKNYRNNVVTKGLAASPGAAVGTIVFDKETAVKLKTEGKSIILVRKETSPEDIAGMHASIAVLTSTGGLSSHAAVVMRGWGKPCVVGAETCSIDYVSKTLTIGGTVLHEGDTISLNSTTGEVIVGEWPLSKPEWTNEVETVLNWCDEIRTLGIRTNCETAEEATLARKYGAEGIGLFRTEHMFYGRNATESLYLMKKMILATSQEEKSLSLIGLKEPFKKSFKETFIAMDGLPVTVRLLDPPLHEFAAFSKPSNKEDKKEQNLMKKRLCKDLGISLNELHNRVDSLHESNPGSGFRGCRLGVIYPQITVTQIEALLETVLELKNEGYHPHLEIEVPFAFNYAEYHNQYLLIMETAKKFISLEHGKDFKIGCMIENMGACFESNLIAQSSDFLTFGTNDLSSFVLAISRDDASRFIAAYVEKKILAVDPFQTLHPLVAKAMKMAIEGGRYTKEELEFGICGEQGGDPVSIAICQKLGLSYVSCSPFRIPIARLSAAQAALID